MCVVCDQLETPVEAFASTDALFQRAVGVTSVIVVDAMLAASQDILLLPRLLQFLAQERIVAELSLNDDDEVLSRFCKCLDVILLSVAEGMTDVGDVFHKRSDARHAYQEMFVCKDRPRLLRKRPLETVAAAMPSQKSARREVPSSSKSGAATSKLSSLPVAGVSSTLPSALAADMSLSSPLVPPPAPLTSLLPAPAEQLRADRGNSTVRQWSCARVCIDTCAVVCG